MEARRLYGHELRAGDLVFLDCGSTDSGTSGWASLLEVELDQDQVHLRVLYFGVEGEYDELIDANDYFDTVR